MDDSQDPLNDDGWQEVTSNKRPKRAKASIRPDTSATGLVVEANRFALTCSWLCSIEPGMRFGIYPAHNIPVAYPHGSSVTEAKKADIERGIRRLFSGEHLDGASFELMREKCFNNKAEPYLVINCRYVILYLNLYCPYSSTC